LLLIKENRFFKKVFSHVCSYDIIFTIHRFEVLQMKKDYNYSLIRERLKKLREQKGWSQDEASKAVGAGKGAWQQWELGKRNPSMTALIAVSYVFNVHINYICGLTDIPTPQTMVIPATRLQKMDRSAIEAYLSLESSEKAFIRQAMDFIQMHKRKK